MAQRIGKRRDRSFDEDTSCLSSQAVEIQALFQQYQIELDSSHDKRERLVKLSRDITIQSKRIIFLLHRVLPLTDKVSILSEAECKLQDVTKLLHKIAEELVDDDPTRYINAYSIGIQEYIEALSFYYYWKDGTLLSYSLAQHHMTFHYDHVGNDEQETNSLVLFLNPFNYLLGLTDLSGELMRVAINSVGLGQWSAPCIIVKFVRELYSGLIAVNHYSMNKEFLTKLEMTLNNLLKIEQACYALKIRDTEAPKDIN